MSSSCHRSDFKQIIHCISDEYSPRRARLLSRARFSSACCAASRFSGLPRQARSAGCANLHAHFRLADGHDTEFLANSTIVHVADRPLEHLLVLIVFLLPIAASYKCEARILFRAQNSHRVYWFSRHALVFFIASGAHVATDIRQGVRYLLLQLYGVRKNRVI